MSGTPESIYVPKHCVEQSVLATSAREIVGEAFERVRAVTFPGYWAVDLGIVDTMALDDMLSAFESALGQRPLLMSEVERFFDPATGERLVA